MAFAIIALAVGSTVSITALTVPEISAGDGVTVMHVAKAQAQTQVLGDSITLPVIDDSALEGGDSVGKLQIKPSGYDATSGRGSVKISFQVSNLSSTAELRIGRYVVSSTITQSGDIDSGNILKPATLYHVSLWAKDSSGSLQKIASADIKTPKGKIPMPDQISGRDQTGSSTPSTECTKEHPCTNMPHPSFESGKQGQSQKVLPPQGMPPQQ